MRRSCRVISSPKAVRSPLRWVASSSSSLASFTSRPQGGLGDAVLVTARGGGQLREPDQVVAVARIAGEVDGRVLRGVGAAGEPVLGPCVEAGRSRVRPVHLDAG